jgi:methyltransferase
MRPSQFGVAAVSLLVVVLLMLAESLVSRRNEQQLRQRGAIEPPGDVYLTMRWAYPAAFVAMAAEGAVFGPPAPPITLAGVALFIAAKALKWWAMVSLGTRWAFRVLIVPDPLVKSGPYAVLRHPNYVAVVGELVSMALIVGARVSGPLTLLLFGLLIRRRIRVENRALRHPPCT